MLVYFSWKKVITLLCEMHTIPKLTFSVIQLVPCTWKGKKHPTQQLFINDISKMLVHAQACPRITTTPGPLDYKSSKQGGLAHQRPRQPSGRRRPWQPRLVPPRPSTQWMGIKVHLPHLHLQPAWRPFHKRPSSPMRRGSSS